MNDSTTPSCTTCTRRVVLAGAGIAAVALATGCGSGMAQSTPARVPLSDIPVGGGRVIPDSRVVVTQPVPGTYRAFSAVCPHQGCSVGSVADGAIECPCHGSRFSIEDGSVLRGPAREPLAARTATTADGVVVVE